MRGVLNFKQHILWGAGLATLFILVLLLYYYPFNTFTLRSDVSYRLSAGFMNSYLQLLAYSGGMGTVNAKIRKCMPLLTWNSERENVAVIVPYRNRREHLLKFLTRLLPFLRKKRKHYIIVIIEQAGNQSFNRAKLFNSAVMEIKKSHPGDRLHGINCYILHDVDKVPTSSSAVYECGQHVKQLATAFKSDTETRWLYESFLGAVTAFTWEHIEKINGASNIFYGWGGEVDDLSIRLQLNNITVDKAVGNNGIFYEFDSNHERDENVDRINLTTVDNVTSRWKNDGIKQTRYHLLSRFDFDFFVWLLVSI